MQALTNSTHKSTYKLSNYVNVSKICKKKLPLSHVFMHMYNFGVLMYCIRCRFYCW